MNLNPINPELWVSRIKIKKKDNVSKNYETDIVCETDCIYVKGNRRHYFRVALLKDMV